MNKVIIKNTSMLYVMNIAKMIIPLLTLPYLSRVLSVECNGTVTYVKALMQYMQLLVDFGFILSGTRSIVEANNNKEIINKEVSKVLYSKLFLSLIGLLIVIICSLCLDILDGNFMYTILSYTVVILTCFLFDYYFRGIEEMQIITIRFVLMKGIATALTFVFVKSDNDILWIPILDILGSVIAILLVVFELKKRKVKIVSVKMSDIISATQNSFVYFLSSIATTAFLALNTILIGVFLTKNDVAFWGLCLQMVSAVLALYTPLSDGIFPHMVKTKDFSIIKKSLKIYMPIICVGCIFTFFVAKYAILIIGGSKYLDAVPVLKAMIPVLFFGFPSVLFGWPVLGPIGKEKENTAVTVLVAVVQILGLILLIISNKFTILNIALFRGITESLLFILRFVVFWKNKDMFQNVSKKV